MRFSGNLVRRSIVHHRFVWFWETCCCFDGSERPNYYDNGSARDDFGVSFIEFREHGTYSSRQVCFITASFDTISLIRVRHIWRFKGIANQILPYAYVHLQISPRGKLHLHIYFNPREIYCLHANRSMFTQQIYVSWQYVLVSRRS